MKNTDREVIERFADVIGLGRVYGPYRNTESDGYRRKPFWAWTAFEEDALDVMQLLGSWLTRRRLEWAVELTGLRFPVDSLPL